MGSRISDGAAADDRLGPAAHRLFQAQGLAVAIALTLAAPALAAEEAGGCPAGAARVELVLEDPPPVLSAAGRIVPPEGGAAAPPGARLHHLGLTTSRVAWGSEMETRWREGEGGICARPARVTLRLAQTEHRIRIAREIPEGGCLWRAVEAHERRHVAVNRATLRHAAAEARQAAEAWAGRAEGRGPTMEAAVAALQEGLRQAIEPALAGMRKAREAAHAAIDTPEEYARLGRICPEDRARLRARLGRPG
ncbi:hypothetical protein [Roseicella aerolata]|uniref:DUF922 domain-containing protein n=1 Tax=Roseicella aerolata TaxID=2883479 RepID=A0A9X1IF33_9PROT|nr:hypothetical protein [Roseicella aerolata]MCB4823560.1 hypothetical protein [Roseicella aerolata]